MSIEDYNPSTCHEKIKTFKYEAGFTDELPCCAHCQHSEGSGCSGGLLTCTKADHKFVVKPYAHCKHFHRVGTPEKMDLGQLLMCARTVGQFQLCFSQLKEVRESVIRMNRSIAESMGGAMVTLEGVLKDCVQFLKTHEDDVK